MDDKALEVLKDSHGPSSAIKGDAKRYMVDSAFRAQIDKKDLERGTTTGKQLKDIFYGRVTAAEEAPAPVAKPTAVQLAATIKKFSRERCHDLFLREANKPGEVYADLPKAERDEAKLAAQHFGILPSEGGANVRFSYETRRDRDAKRAAKEAAAQEVQRKASEVLPPGVQRDAKGDLTLVDSVAFEQWKAEKAANLAAIKFLEDAA